MAKPTLIVRAIGRDEPGGHYQSTRLKRIVADRLAATAADDAAGFLAADLALIAFIEARCEASDGADPTQLLQLLSRAEFDDLANQILGNPTAPLAKTNGRNSTPGLAARARRPSGRSIS